MPFGIQGASGNPVESDAQGNLFTNLPIDPSLAGAACVAAEVHNGELGATRLVRPLDASVDFRTRVGVDSLLWNDIFNHAILNTSKYAGITSTMTIVLGGGRMAFNAGNAVASGNVARVQTFKTFPLFLSYPLYVDYEVLFTQDPVQNAVCEFGLGYAATTAAPTDGVFFRMNASGQLIGVINYNGSETTTALSFVPQANNANHYLVVAHNDVVEFWIDDVLYGVINTPAAVGSPAMSMTLPLLMRQYNAAITSVAQQMQVSAVSVSLADMAATRLWATTKAGMGDGSYNASDGATAGQSANYVNSTIPSSATLSNTAAGYTTLGGGIYSVLLTIADTDTTGELVLKATGSGCMDTHVVMQVMASMGPGSDPWEVDLPGSYPVGSAGEILGNLTGGSGGLTTEEHDQLMKTLTVSKFVGLE